MKHWALVWLTFGGLITGQATISAAEPPHLDFVHGLRTKGLADYALKYLQELSKNPPAGLAVVLPLELARTRLDAAQTMADPAARLAEQAQAKAEFDLFIKNNPSHPLAAEASLEIARIAVMQGKGLLSQARREEDSSRQKSALNRARLQFEEAGKQLTAAALLVDARLAAYAGQTSSQAEIEKRSLTQARLQADLELGISYLDQAKTLVDQGEAAARAQLYKKAIDVLENLGKRAEGQPIGWLAKVWLGRSHQDNDDPKTARRIYAEIIAEPGEDVDAARRLARYFRMQALLADATDARKGLADVRKAGEEWLQLYPQHVNTAEGAGVRFELAKTLTQIAMASPRTTQSRLLLEQAQKLFQALEQSDSEFTTQAHENKLQIILQLAYERSRDDIGKLNSFQECYLRAQLEIARLHEDGKKLKGKELQDAKKQHFLKIIEALERALDLADASVPFEESADARYLLTFAYLSIEDYYRAAVAGEYLARHEPRAARAALAGAYALKAYAALVGKSEEAGVSREELQSERGRLRSLAAYVEERWPGDPSADIGRHMMGWLHHSDKHFPEAVAVLQRISPGYPDAPRALFQLADAALQAEKDETLKHRKGAPSYQDLAIAALARLPDVTASSDAGSIQAYVGCKQLLAGIYYRTKQYDKMETLAEGLARRLEEIGGDARTEHALPVQILTLYAKLGRAEAECAAGRYAKAREIVAPAVKQLTDPAQAENVSKIKEKDAALARAVLSVALRAQIQDGQIESGRQLLDKLQRLFPENAQQILFQFVRQLDEQVRQLRSQGQPAEAQLNKTIASFTSFLDVLARQQEQNPRPEILLFLAHSYASLDNHARAAELVSRIPAPPPASPDKPADAKMLAYYRAGQIVLLRELRLSKEFDKAALVLGELRKSKWGQQNLEVEMERIRLLEDQEKYVLPGKQGAIPEWNKLMQSLRPRLADNKVKEQYFECYYHLTYCIYRHALKVPDPMKRLQSLRVAATYVLRLEQQTDAAADVCKKRFAELLQREATLKEQYDELKKNS